MTFLAIVSSFMSIIINKNDKKILGDITGNGIEIINQSKSSIANYF